MTKIYTLDEIADIAWSHGFVFGKYTRQVNIDEGLQAVLDNSIEGITQYMQSFNAGFDCGLCETSRLHHNELSTSELSTTSSPQPVDMSYLWADL